MGDVVTALARAVQEEGHEVDVILPKYDIINFAEVSIDWGHPVLHRSLLDVALAHLYKVGGGAIEHLDSCQLSA